VTSSRLHFTALRCSGLRCAAVKRIDGWAAMAAMAAMLLLQLLLLLLLPAGKESVLALATFTTCWPGDRQRTRHRRTPLRE